MELFIRMVHNNPIRDVSFKGMLQENSTHDVYDCRKTRVVMLEMQKNPIDDVEEGVTNRFFLQAC